jgi:SAM-dependent methyltransferase
MACSQEGSSPLPTLEDIWRQYDAVEARLSAPLSERMLDLAGVQPGMRVLDLATGRGEPALRAASRVGSQGSVLGVDLSAEMLRLAREAADRDGLANLDLRVGNAESLDDLPRNHFHAATIRWGLMYMGAPIAALTNVHRALVPDGPLVVALWGEPERASFFTLPRRLLERYRPLPPLDPEAPGPFRYADRERVVRDFTRAGFAIDHVEDMEVPVFEAETGTEIVVWVRALGSGMRQLLSDLPANDQQAWERDLTAAVERTRTDGLMRLGGVTRIVRARPMPGARS